MIGDKISASHDANFQQRVSQGSNLENFLSMAGHYGTSRPLLHPGTEIQKKMTSSEKSLSKQAKTNRSNNKIKEDIRNQYNHLMLLSNENKNVKNISIEDPNSNRHNVLEVETSNKYTCESNPMKKESYGKDTCMSKNISNHSPLLTKRKISQKRGGNSTVRNKNKHQKNYSNSMQEL